MRPLEDPSITPTQLASESVMFLFVLPCGWLLVVVLLRQRGELHGLEGSSCKKLDDFEPLNTFTQAVSCMLSISGGSVNHTVVSEMVLRMQRDMADGGVCHMRTVLYW